jgi:hypothetical protein
VRTSEDHRCARCLWGIGVSSLSVYTDLQAVAAPSILPARQILFGNVSALQSACNAT